MSPIEFEVEDLETETRIDRVLSIILEIESGEVKLSHPEFALKLYYRMLYLLENNLFKSLSFDNNGNLKPLE